MKVVWEHGRALADREALAAIYEVSTRTVRRHCIPVTYEPRGGQRRGNAHYDVLTAGDALAHVAPRPARAAAARRYRMPHSASPPPPGPER